MVLDTQHQKFDVILSKLVRGWQTAWRPVIGSDKPVTALEVRRVHDKGQARGRGWMRQATSDGVLRLSQVQPPPTTLPPPPSLRWVKDGHLQSHGGSPLAADFCGYFLFQAAVSLVDPQKQQQQQTSASLLLLPQPPPFMWGSGGKLEGCSLLMWPVSIVTLRQCICSQQGHWLRA